MASAVLGFLIDIAKAWRSDRISLKTAQVVFHAVLQDFIPNIKLADLDKSGERKTISSYYHLPRAFLDSKQIIQVIRQCVSLDLGPQVHQLFDKLERLASDEEPAIIFNGLFLPLAKELNEMTADQNPGALAQEVHNMACLFTEKLLSLYANRCVGPKPTPPKDWMRTKCGCGCEECLQLDSFLVDPALEEMHIPASSEDRLRHLQTQLPLIQRKPEYETEIRRTSSGFELWVHKTKLAWAFSVECWVKDRDVAKEIFDRVFDGDKDMGRDLENAFKKLGEEM